MFVCVQEYRGKSWKVDYTEDLPPTFLFCVQRRVSRARRNMAIVTHRRLKGRVEEKK